jgi:putative transposase
VGCHHGFGSRLSESKIQIAFLGETKRTIPRSRPASGRASRAGLVQDAACGTGAQRRLVLDETEHGAMLVQVGPPASSKTAMPNHVLPVIPGDRNELVECHSEATRGRSPVSPDRPTKIVLRRSVESAQYAASEYRDILRAAAITQSMSRKANCWDNAPMESFYATLKGELVEERDYLTRDEARADVFQYVEGFYNRSSQSTCRYVVDENRFCWPGSGTAGGDRLF